MAGPHTQAALATAAARDSHCGSEPEGQNAPSRNRGVAPPPPPTAAARMHVTRNRLCSTATRCRPSFVCEVTCSELL